MIRTIIYPIFPLIFYKRMAGSSSSNSIEGRSNMELKLNNEFYANYYGFQFVDFRNSYYHIPVVPEEESGIWSEEHEIFVLKKIMNT